MMLKLSPHVIPETDTRPHFRGNNASCWCRPRIKDGVIIHRGKDERTHDYDQAWRRAKSGWGWEDLMVTYRITEGEARDMVFGRRR